MLSGIYNRQMKDIKAKIKILETRSRNTLVPAPLPILALNCAELTSLWLP